MSSCSHEARRCRFGPPLASCRARKHRACGSCRASSMLFGASRHMRTRSKRRRFARSGCLRRKAEIKDRSSRRSEWCRAFRPIRIVVPSCSVCAGPVRLPRDRVAAICRELGLAYRRNVRSLPGSPTSPTNPGVGPSSSTAASGTSHGLQSCDHAEAQQRLLDQEIRSQPPPRCGEDQRTARAGISSRSDMGMRGDRRNGAVPSLVKSARTACRIGPADGRSVVA